MLAKSIVGFGLACALSAAACGRSSSATAERTLPDAAPAAAASAPDARPVGTPQPRLPMGTLDLIPPDGPPIHLRVEIASKADERQKGLMFRERLGNDEGMLFIFPTERYNSFWMHNTLIPLDMLFIDAEWNVVGIVERAEPLTDDPRGVQRMSQYVLELNGGFAASHRLGPGTKVKFVPPQSLELP